MADERLADAKALAQAGRHSAAYYLAGYAVECALKACICRRTNQDDFPPRDANTKFYIHNLENLANQISETPGVWKRELDADPRLAINWSIAKDWKEDARYEFWTEDEARDLILSIEIEAGGVLTCLRKHW